MGAVAFIVFLIIVLGFGLVVTLVGLIGTILSAARKRKSLCAVMVVLLVIGTIITVLPIGLGALILYPNTIVPSDFVDTGIVIEGHPFRDGYFAVEGIRYCELDLYANYETCAQIATPVFSYKPDGILNRSQWANLYHIKNSQGFDLVWSTSGRLYCPENQVNVITNYYSTCPHSWACYVDGRKISLSPTATTALDIYYTQTSSEPAVPIQAPIVLEAYADCYSSDGIIVLDYIDFVVTKNGLYEASVIDLDSDTHELIYEGWRVPDALAAPLLKDFGD